MADNQPFSGGEFMTLQLTLPPDLEARLQQEGQRRRLAPDVTAVQLLHERLVRPEKTNAGVALLQQWEQEDATLTEEEIAANAELLRAVDEDRLSDRKLFTDVLKDKSA